MIRAPITIKIMLACYVGPDAEREVGIDVWNSEAGRESRFWLEQNGLIDKNERATEKGRAWVDFIVNTPLPVSVWVLPSERNGLTEEEKDTDQPHPNLVRLMRSTPPWGQA